MGSRLVQLSFVVAGLGACGGLLLLSMPRWREYQAGAVAAPPSTLVQRTPRPARNVVPATTSLPVQVPVPTDTANLQLVAARGSCWIVIRSVSATGTIRYAGILEQGGSVRAAGPRLWVSLGAAGNLDVTLNRRLLQTFPTGTIDVIVTPTGVSRAPFAAPVGAAGGAAA